MSNFTFFDIASAKLWADFPEEDSYPTRRPLLAHYTSMQTFEQIATKEQFWFSNPLFMNDSEELRFGIQEGAAEFYRSEAIRNACGNTQNHERLLSNFQDILTNYDSEHVLNTYVLCFSEHAAEDSDGLLSMWRGYGNGGSGAALVIDTGKINETPGSPLIFGKVRYGSKAERLKWIGQKIADLAELIEKHAKTDDDFFNAARAWFQRLKSFALFSKHSGFHEEREWRIVYMSDRDKDEKFKQFFGHVATNRGIEPKLKLPIKPVPGLTSEDISLEKLVNRIILGPSIASALGVNSLKQMLRNINKDSLIDRVVASDIPFRQTN
jgi:hypothetical protein